MEEITTTDLSKFGWREKRMAQELLKAAQDQGFPDDFENDAVTIMMNTHSGNVFLTNSSDEVAMLNGEKLQSFYSSPYKGLEGFFEDLLEEYPDMQEDDKEWFENVAENLNRSNELPNKEQQEP